MDRHRWDERYAAKEQTFVRHPNPLIEPEVVHLPAGTALDLATGEGRHAVWLASLGWRVVAVDFSPVGVTRAAARAEAEGVAVAFAVADVFTLRLPNERFDLVLASFFHPRPGQRADLYPAIRTTLRPGGSLLQVSYALANLTEGTGGPQDPQLLIDAPVLAADLRGYGFEVVRAETVRVEQAVDAVIHARAPGP